MIRFIDVTRQYFCLEPDEEVSMPICSFVNTVTSKFVEDDGKMHLFHGFDDVDSIEPPELRQRCRAVIPNGFFNPSSEYWKPKSISVRLTQEEAELVRARMLSDEIWGNSTSAEMLGDRIAEHIKKLLETKTWAST